MPNRTIRSFSYGIAGLIGGIAFLVKGVALMGVLALLLGAALLSLAISDEIKRRPHAAADKAAAKAYRAARPKPFTVPRAMVGDLVILEKANSNFWLGTVCSVDRQSRVARVATIKGARLKVSWLQGPNVRMHVVSADKVDVADAMSKELARSEAKQEWTSLDEVRALLVRAKGGVGDPR